MPSDKRVKTRDERKVTLINFELDTDEVAKYTNFAENVLKKSRTQLIKDALSDYYDRYYNTRPKLESVSEVKRLEEQKTQLVSEMEKKMEVFHAEINKLPSPQLKMADKSRIVELLKLSPMRAIKIASLTGIDAAEVLKILEEQRKLGTIEFKNGEWRLLE